MRNQNVNLHVLVLFKTVLIQIIQVCTCLKASDKHFLLLFIFIASMAASHDLHMTSSALHSAGDPNKERLLNIFDVIFKLSLSHFFEGGEITSYLCLSH
jgi:hypothetical protein